MRTLILATALLILACSSMGRPANPYRCSVFIEDHTDKRLYDFAKLLLSKFKRMNQYEHNCDITGEYKGDTTNITQKYRSWLIDVACNYSKVDIGKLSLYCKDCNGTWLKIKVGSDEFSCPSVYPENYIYKRGSQKLQRIEKRISSGSRSKSATYKKDFLDTALGLPKSKLTRQVYNRYGSINTASKAQKGQELDQTPSTNTDGKTKEPVHWTGSAGIRTSNTTSYISEQSITTGNSVYNGRHGEQVNMNRSQNLNSEYVKLLNDTKDVESFINTTSLSEHSYYDKTSATALSQNEDTNTKLKIDDPVFVYYSDDDVTRILQFDDVPSDINNASELGEREEASSDGEGTRNHTEVKEIEKDTPDNIVPSNDALQNSTKGLLDSLTSTEATSKYYIQRETDTVPFRLTVIPYEHEISTIDYGIDEEDEKFINTENNVNNSESFEKLDNQKTSNTTEENVIAASIVVESSINNLSHAILGPDKSSNKETEGLPMNNVTNIGNISAHPSSSPRPVSVSSAHQIHNDTPNVINNSSEVLSDIIENIVEKVSIVGAIKTATHKSEEDSVSSESKPEQMKDEMEVVGNISVSEPRIYINENIPQEHNCTDPKTDLVVNFQQEEYTNLNKSVPTAENHETGISLHHVCHCNQSDVSQTSKIHKEKLPVTNNHTNEGRQKQNVDLDPILNAKISKYEGNNVNNETHMNSLLLDKLRSNLNIADHNEQVVQQNSHPTNGAESSDTCDESCECHNQLSTFKDEMNDSAVNASNSVQHKVNLPHPEDVDLSTTSDIRIILAKILELGSPENMSLSPWTLVVNDSEMDSNLKEDITSLSTKRTDHVDAEEGNQRPDVKISTYQTRVNVIEPKVFITEGEPVSSVTKADSTSKALLVSYTKQVDGISRVLPDGEKSTG